MMLVCLYLRVGVLVFVVTEQTRAVLRERIKFAPAAKI